MKLLKVFLIFTIVVCVIGSSNGDGTSSSTTESATGEATTGIHNNSSTSGSTTGITQNQTACFAFDCNDCVKDMNCVWCQSSSVCVPGHWFGGSSSCSDWRWKQCQVNGKYTLLGVLGGIGFLLLIALVCVCCCCCVQKKKNSKKQFKDFKEFKAIQLEEESKENLLSKHPKTDSRRAELMKKYSSKLNNSKTLPSSPPSSSSYNNSDDQV